MKRQHFELTLAFSKLTLVTFQREIDFSHVVVMVFSVIKTILLPHKQIDKPVSQHNNLITLIKNITMIEKIYV